MTSSTFTYETASGLPNRPATSPHETQGQSAFYKRLDALLTREGKLLDLQVVLGIRDKRILERFLSLGFTPQTAPAIELAPIAFVAWASNSVTDEECATAVSAIFESQLSEFPKTWAVVQTWLDIRPNQEIWDLWVKYMQCRLELMTGRQKAGLHQRLKNEARLVARASGGWLGIGSVCPEEQSVLNAIDNVFLGN